MKIELTNEQIEETAIAWIASQQKVDKGYKQVLDTLLMSAHFADWSWLDAIKYAVKKCAKAYACTTGQIAEGVK